MKIVDYKTFISMPEGTLYAEYKPCYFGELYVKGETINDGNDWFLSRTKESWQGDEQFVDQCELMVAGNELRGDYDIQERDGMFDYNRMFLVYDKTDIQDLINHLTKLIK